MRSLLAAMLGTSFPAYLWAVKQTEMSKRSSGLKIGVLCNSFKDWLGQRWPSAVYFKKQPAMCSPVMHELAGDERRDSASGPVGLSSVVVINEKKGGTGGEM